MAASIVTGGPTGDDLRTEKQKMLAGDPYLGMHEDLLKERQACRKLLREYNDADDADLTKRDQIIKKLFGKTGQNIYVEPPFRCDYGYNMTVGNNFYCNFNCCFLDVNTITIGDNCIIAPGVQIYTATHPIDAALRISGVEYGKPVIIGHNVWVGGCAIINPNITVGDNVVIASGSVVTKDIPSNVVVAGVPAKIIRQIDPPKDGVGSAKQPFIPAK